MKLFNLSGKAVLLSGVALFVCLCVSTVYGQDVAKPDSLKKDSLLIKSAAIYQVVKPACMPCHSDAGRDKPRNAVNFSVWEKYTSMEQKMLGSSIQKELAKKSMPPKGFVNSHPDAALNEAQIAQLVQWCDSLKAKL